jgi:succinate dehydrogenase / fumarate reductase iron-sulfur subunit
MKSTFSVYRYDPKVDKKPRYQDYEVDTEPTDKILDCLNKIRWEQDPTLAYRYSCAHGICGSDALMINGRIELACQKLVRDFKTGNNFVIEPLPLFDVVKDLIVDLVPFFEKYRQVQPYLIGGKNESDKEFIQSSENQDASCTAACPVNRARSDYLGPAALLRAFRYIFDSRDSITEERLKKIDDPDGVWGCKTMWWCTEVCPKQIPITKCLGQIKRAAKQKEKGG